MIASALFIIGFIIIYLTRPKAKAARYKGLKLLPKEFEKKEILPVQKKEKQLIPFPEPIQIELTLERQKEIPREATQVLQSEKLTSNSIQELEPMPVLQHVTLFENSTPIQAQIAQPVDLEIRKGDVELSVVSDQAVLEETEEIPNKSNFDVQSGIQSTSTVDIKARSDEPSKEPVILLENEHTLQTEQPITVQNEVLPLEAIVENPFSKITEEIPTEQANSVKVEVSKEIEDDSIIDVEDHTGPIDYQNTLETIIPKELEIPTWPQCYIYSISALSYTTKDQRKFYDYFKKCFFKDELLDLNENTNYAFVLLFELLQEYDQKRLNLLLLDQQFKKLEKCCPKTQIYTRRYLRERMKEAGDVEGIERIEEEEYQQRLNASELNYNDWRRTYKKKSKLNLEDAKFLDKIGLMVNPFLKVEFCFLEVLKLYINTIHFISNQYSSEGTSREKEFTYVADIVAKKHHGYKPEYHYYKGFVESLSDQFFLYAFKYAENKIRNSFGHKQKIGIEIINEHRVAEDELKIRIIDKICQAIEALTGTISAPNEQTVMLLNVQNSTRWKNSFEELVSNFVETNSNIFYSGIMELGRLNSLHSGGAQIYFDACKFLGNYNKLLSLNCYLHYVFYNQKHKKLDLKQMPKSIEKRLFPTSEQRNHFHQILIQLLQQSNLEEVLKEAESLYGLKRKRITLNLEEIKQVEEQHSETVRILNEYLKDDEDENANLPLTIEPAFEILSNSVAVTSTSSNGPAALYKVVFSSTESELIELFKENSFTLDANSITTFCKEKGAAKNALILNINETCYDLLDDILIEEDGHEFSINLTYYNQIINE